MRYLKMTYRRTKKTKNKNKNVKRLQIAIGDLFCYCEERNIGIRSRDNYEALKAYVTIHKLFENHYFIIKRERSFSDLLSELDKNKKYLEYLYKLSLVNEKDYRSGEESYGYDNIDYVKERMSYISDRWNCAFRIRWILDLLEKSSSL